MITIEEVRRIASDIQSIGTKKTKLEYVSKLPDTVNSILSGNINMDRIGHEIGGRITIGNVSDDLEQLIETFDVASKLTGRLDKERIISQLTLTEQDYIFIMQCLYPQATDIGSIKLGITIPQPTDFNDRIKPMLAKSKTFDPSEFIIERKYDGHRCLIKRDKIGNVYLTSRNGKEMNVENIRIAGELIPEGTILDGEIISPDDNFEKLNIHGDVIYKAFDILYLDNKSVMKKPLSYRRDTLENIIDNTSILQISDILDLSTMEDINDWITKSGAEGIVGKDPNGLYNTGKRDWVKYKHTHDLNAKIVGMTAGTGKRSGMLGAIVITPEGLGGVETKVGTGFSDIELEAITQRINAGEQLNCVVRYQDVTKAKKLRFPVFVRLI